MKMLKEFKKFIMRGNVLDLAIAVVLAAAFGAVVNALVNDIIMPIVGYLLSGINFSDLQIVLKEAVMDGETVVTPIVAITYGHLIQIILQFIVVAFTIFLVIRMVAKLRKKQEEAPAAKAADVVLLEEIRDLLKNSKAD